MRAKKHLGQHFLTSKAYAQRIVEAGAVEKNDTVLEIGPGKGILTEELLKRAGKVVVVEKDADMIPILKEKYKSDEKNGNLVIFEGDVRDYSLNLQELGLENQYKLIANIPYYITGELLRMFLTHEHKPSCIVFLVQKEVAERIVARDRKESLLSLSVKVYGEPKIVAKVSKGNFSPPPKVDSAILLIENISDKHFHDKQQESRFFELLHAGFAHKRKLLVRNLETVTSPERIQKAFDQCGIQKTARSEDVPLEKWLCLLTNL